MILKSKGQTTIGQHQMAVGRHKYIVGFDVAVNNVLGVEFRNRFHYWTESRKRMEYASLVGIQMS